ncbi:protein kinase activating protein dpb11 [Sporothrix epigloea]|uniref:Protein kinase activating protein dpb11 n=1 Tax=Sporothrix epigloea TaxID=1892477 RepID=A0ABP0DCV9_9PEZI
METLPFAGVVLCCTSIPVDLRDDLAKKVSELGGVHKPDLTHEVTHLIVGDYDTPKYRHVARDRPDIKPMCIGWVDAVLDLWTRDAPMDLPALEEAWRLRPLEVHGGLPEMPDGVDEEARKTTPAERGRLLCSVTGFEEEDREAVISMIVENGGVYSGDLTRNVTHLIVNKPEGKKYNAALHWKVYTVAVEWLRDSVARGMILEETKYDPRLPSSERGKGAWVRNAAERTASILGKRLRDAAAQAAAEKQKGIRKLRKTTSQKLSVQRDDLWGDILGKPADPVTSAAPAEAVVVPRGNSPPKNVVTRSTIPSNDAAQIPKPKTDAKTPGHVGGGILSTSIFFIHGFNTVRTNVLAGAVATMGGTVASSLTEMSAISSRWPAAPLFKHVIVPQEQRPTAHPTVADDVVLVTEFFIEQCLHKKMYALPGGPSTAHALESPGTIGRPFPTFPIPGFDMLSICSSGFTGVDLNQVDKTIRQLGARYEERFTAQCSVLVCTSFSAVRSQKLELAVQWRVPVVDARWLQACIASGTRAPVDAYLFPQLRQIPGDFSFPVSRSRPTLPKANVVIGPEPAVVPTLPTQDMGSPETLRDAHSEQQALHAHGSETRQNDTAVMARGQRPPLQEGKNILAQPTDGFPTTAATTNKLSPTMELSTRTTVPPLSKRPSVHNPFRSDSDSPPSKPQSLPAPQPSARPQPSSQPPPPPPPPQQMSRKPLNRVLSEIADSATGDDSDDALSIDGAAGINKVSPRKQLRQQAQAKSIQRSATADVYSGPATTRPPRPALSRVVSDGLAAATHQHRPAIPMGISIGDLMKDGGSGSFKQRPQSHAQRSELNQRPSGGFGRTFSSVSGMSVPESDGQEGAIQNAANSGDDDDAVSLPPTQAQLQYLDPEAERIREQLMRKILGGGAPADLPVVDAQPSTAFRDVNLADGVAVQRAGTAEEALAKARHHVRRSSRLR